MALKPLIAGMSQGSAGGAGGAPSGAAGGGLGGTYPNPTVNPQLPAWTYTADSITNGLFTNANGFTTAAISGTSSLTFSKSILGDVSVQPFGSGLPKGRLIMVDANGISTSFSTGATAGDGSDNIIVGVTLLKAGTTNFSGKYTVSFVQTALVPTDVGLGNVTNELQLIASNLDTDGTLNANSDLKLASQKATKTYADSLGIVLDSGWVPNADAGDKAVVIPGVTTIATNVATAVAGLDPTGTLGLNAALGHLASVAEKVKAIEYALSTQKRPNA